MLDINASKTDWETIPNDEATAMLRLIVANMRTVEDIPNASYAFQAVANYKPLAVYQAEFTKFISATGRIAMDAPNPQRTRAMVFEVAAKISTLMRQDKTQPQEEHVPTDKRLRREDVARILLGATVHGFRLIEVTDHTGIRGDIRQDMSLRHVPSGEVVHVSYLPQRPQRGVVHTNNRGGGQEFRYLPQERVSAKGWNAYRGQQAERRFSR